MQGISRQEKAIVSGKLRCKATDCVKHTYECATYKKTFIKAMFEYTALYFSHTLERKTDTLYNTCTMPNPSHEHGGTGHSLSGPSKTNGIPSCAESSGRYRATKEFEAYCNLLEELLLTQKNPPKVLPSADRQGPRGESMRVDEQQAIVSRHALTLYVRVDAQTTMITLLPTHDGHQRSSIALLKLPCQTHPSSISTRQKPHSDNLFSATLLYHAQDHVV